ncbi:uncharacterized protein VTP21DRAFT_3775 [Calcarisporiella thermophila]|uniref:uncharacterized protein n=1 Tax=Calcarisporiella thermophila TaxID=911321 RepID=UPI00374214FD
MYSVRHLFALERSSVLERALLNTPKRYAHKQSTIQVQLKSKLKGLGKPGDVVSVKPGYMRNNLLPNGLASYIVKSKGARDRKAEQEADNLRAQAARITAESADNLQIRQSQAVAAALSLVSKLRSLPPLRFKRAIVPNSVQTYGSVTAEDVVEGLRKKGIAGVSKGQVSADRIKTVGEHTCKVHIGESEVDLKVLVEPA